MAVSESFKKEVKDILDRERWQGYVSGKVEGALNVLYLMDLDKEKRIKLLQEAVGLSNMTATDFVEPREIEDRIFKNKELSGEEKGALNSLMKNEAMKDQTVLDHPLQMLKLISSVEDDRFIEECLPQVEQWVKNGEEVTMLKVRNWLIQKYNLF